MPIGFVVMIGADGPSGRFDHDGTTHHFIDERLDRAPCIDKGFFQINDGLVRPSCFFFIRDRINLHGAHKYILLCGWRLSEQAFLYDHPDHRDHMMGAYFFAVFIGAAMIGDRHFIHALRS